MRHLEFPVSAAAVHLHGREFHAQDFFDSSRTPVTSEAGGRLGSAASNNGSDPVEATNRAAARRSGIRSQLRHLARWTSICVGVAVVAAVVLSWLVRPDLRQVKWVDSVAPVHLGSKG